MTGDELFNTLVQIPWSEIYLRAGTTALIVLIVALAVSKLGPIIGGLVAGLPMGFAPGFYFLVGSETTQFLFEAAHHSILALSATQLFLFSNMIAHRLGGPLITSTVCILVWFSAVSVLNQLHVDILAASLLFLSLTVLTRHVGKYLLANGRVKNNREKITHLVVRACLGGLAVAAITISSATLGGNWSGILLAFPISFVVICFTTHETFGSAILISFARSALLGSISLAAFCLGFALTIYHLMDFRAVLIGLFASAALSGVMMAFTHGSSDGKPSGTAR